MKNNKFLTNSVTTDPQVHDHQWAKSLGLVSFAGYKLRDANGDPIGVLAMFAKHPISEEDDAFLSNLAETTSRVILDNTAAEELRKTREQAVEANQAKSRFLATMSHEIRTPMTAILGYADLLMDPTISPSSRNNYAAAIRRSGEHCLALINDILDLSKIEAGKMSLDMGRCNVVSLLTDVASIVRPRAEQRGVSFSVECPGEVPETILTDGARLRQAIVNLAGNAVKFTEQGSVRIVASFLPEGCDGQPAVTDRGDRYGNRHPRGSPPAALSTVPPGRRGGFAEVRRHGTGAGHFASHCPSAGRRIDRNQRLGTRKHLHPDRAHGQPQRHPHAPAPDRDGTRDRRSRCGSPPREDLRGVRILLAEDGFDNRELIRTILQRAGAEVETAENGRLAVAKAESGSFDLILMDMNMPEMDGYEATRLLRDRGYRGPIVALTANAMSDDCDRCLAAGCNEYLTKPIDRALLIQTIAAHVGTKSAAERHFERSDGSGDELGGDRVAIHRRPGHGANHPRIRGTSCRSTRRDAPSVGRRPAR